MSAPRFTLRTRVEIADTDLGGVVYYGRYPHLVDRAVIAYRRRLGIPPLGPDGHLFVVRSLALDYLAPARFDDELEIAVRTAEVGRTSHSVHAAIAHAGGGRVAEARLVVVGVSSYGGRPTRVPESLRAALDGFEGR